MGHKSKALVWNRLSKKILCFYVIILMFFSLFSTYSISNDPTIEFKYPPTPVGVDNVTDQTYANISVYINDTNYNSSFINWNNSLVGYWNFEHNTNTEIIDNSTYRNDATFVNSYANIRSGKYGYSSYFNGSIDEYLDCGDNSIFNITNELTIEAWIKENRSTFYTDFGKITGTTDDRGLSVVENTTDGSFIIAGYTKSYGAGYKDLWLIKTDSNGNEVKNVTYGGSENDTAWSIKKTSDDNYVTVGYTESFGAGSRDIWLLKIDSNLNILNNVTHGTTNDDEGYDFVENTTSNHYIVIGYKGNAGPPWKEFWLLELDSQLDWHGGQLNNTYGGNNNEEGLSINLTHDGNYIVTGRTNTYGAGFGDVWFLKIADSGSELINKSMGGNQDDIGYLVSENVTDGSYVIVGYTNSFGAGSRDLWLIKLTSDGNTELINKTYGGTGDDTGVSFQKTADGGYLITGRDDSSKGWILKTDTNGNTLGAHTLFEEDSTLWCIRSTSDGGYVIVGNISKNQGSTDDNLLLIKTNSTGYVTYQDDEQFVAGKSKDTYEITVKNGTVYGYINNTYLSTQLNSSQISQYWNHVALTYNNSSMYLYHNGATVNSTTGSFGAINTSAIDLTIGKNFNGTIDEVRIWNRTLNNDEIIASYSCNGSYSRSFTNLPDWSYSYYVYAINQTGGENQTENRSVTIDTTVPTVSIGLPVNGSWYSSLVNISGTAADTGGSGVSTVNITIFNLTGGKYWTGSAWQNGVAWLGTNGTTSWYNNSGVPSWTSGSTYIVNATATDNASNVGTAASNHFLFDTLSSISAGSITTSSATITWTTNANTSSSVEYGPTTSYGSSSNDATYTTSHSIPITGLSSDTAYHYQVTSVDAFGNSNTSSNHTFTTLTGGGNTPPSSNIAPTADAGGPYSGYTDSVITFSGSGSDTDGTITGYRWDFENDGTYDTSWSTDNTTTHTYSYAGPYTVKLQVKDDDDATGTDTATVTIINETLPGDTIKPTISNLTQSPTKVTTEDNLVTISATVTDNDRVVSVTLHYDAGDTSKDVVMNNETSNSIYSATINGPFTEGEITTYLIEAKDASGNTKQTERYPFTVVAPPTIEHAGDAPKEETKNIDTPGSGTINKVILTPSANLSNLTLTIENLTEDEITYPILNETNITYMVYNYFKIELTANNTYVKEEDLLSAIINFTVKQNWFTEKDLWKENVSLWRYNNTWKTLPTDTTGYDVTDYYYESETPGFSTFAVVGSKVVEKNTETTQTPEIPWLFIIGFIIAGLAALIFVLFKAKLIYVEVEEVDVPKKE